MPAARFKDLCLDATDPPRVGAFWAQVLDRQWRAHDDGDGHLTGPTPQHTVWVNSVLEPKTVKHRVHLDIYARTVEDLVALGARPLETFPGWTVMADPEGGEFCAFLRDLPPAERLHGLAVDARDPDALAAWWADVFGARLLPREHEWRTVEDVPGMPIATMDFAWVPEVKAAKNRIHWDVAADLDDVLDRGATLLRARDDTIGWHVLADPEGNEFCVFGE